MKPIPFVAVVVILAAAVAVPVLVQRRISSVLSEKAETYQQQAELLAQLTAENLRLSNRVARAKISPQLSEAQLAELLKLRNEASQLRRTIDPILSESRRIREALPTLAKHQEPEEDNPAALKKEIPPEVRQARVALLKKWLEQRPEENTPELQFVSETNWLSLAGRERITDDDYAAAMSLLRHIGESAFIKTAVAAVKQYVRASNGQFPTDLYQLQPYFASPVDNAILQRYTIVPASSLNFLGEDWRGGDWVITQKAPVNAKYDSRIAIGLNTYLNTVGPGRWGSAP
jgi:hypothetical protein